MKRDLEGRISRLDRGEDLVGAGSEPVEIDHEVIEAAAQAVLQQLLRARPHGGGRQKLPRLLFQERDRLFHHRCVSGPAPFMPDATMKDKPNRREPRTGRRVAANAGKWRHAKVTTFC
jgi:hypothetical protein